MVLPSRRHTAILCGLWTSALLLSRPAAAPAAGWSPLGTPVVDAPGDQRVSVALQMPDAFSPWSAPWMMLYWEDDRTGAEETDLYDAALDWQGPPGPPFTGVPLVSASGRQTGLALDRTGPTVIAVPAGASRPQSSIGSQVLYAWQDHRSTAAGGVWALKTNTYPAWTDSGIQVCDLRPVEGSIRVAGGDVSGAGIIAWIDDRDGTPRVRAQRLDDTGATAWTPNGIAVSGAGILASSLDAAGDGVGGAYLVWREVEPVSPPVSQHRLILQHLDSGGAPHPGWPAAGLAFGTPSLDVQPASVAPLLVATPWDVFVVWMNPNDATAGATLYAQYVLADGTIAPGWPAQGVAVNGGATATVLAGVALQDALMVGWTDARSGTSLDVYAQRVQFDGTLAPGWDPDGQAVCVAAGDQVVSSIITFGGRTVVGWRDTRAGEDRAYVGGLLADGTVIPGWAGGVELSPVAGGQSGPLLAWTFGDGVIAAWRDGRNAGLSGQDLYAQIVDRYGRVGIQLDGVDAILPASFAVHAPRPNPSAGAVRFAADLPAPCRVAAGIFDVGGRRVATLEEGWAAAGRVEWVWDGRTATGVAAPPGLYLFRIDTGGVARTLRFARLR